MRRARELAEHGRYTAAPNPLVGAVVVRDDVVIGEGWHARAGEDHAEAAALEKSGPTARGAELYVTLEPCNHHGKTPPCTDVILRAGIKRVVAGHLDPNPKMRGRSVEILREAGVEVEVLEDPLFEKQNEQFSHFMNTGRPFVHVKLATTLDGRIAMASGESKWVTGEAARRPSFGRRPAPCSSEPEPRGSTTRSSYLVVSPMTRRQLPASCSTRTSPSVAMAN
jgi:diaminohydroxyphosphoribosylaminopyrimidine deaminase/5-amino-6-(5-phosphoribosylamino)uracil reductase